MINLVSVRFFMFFFFFFPAEDRIPDYFRVPEVRRVALPIPELAKCRQYQVEIFDRSGRLLYRSINNYEPWDGKYEGKNLPRADYWFVVTIHDIDEQIAGHFSLIR
jgi:gliding motility-associated-like protein